jgi:hypothetical protein
MKKKTFFLIAAICCITLLIGCATSYQGTVADKFENEFGDYASYTFRIQPVGNFGVGTMLELRASDKDVVKEDIDTRWLKGHSSTWFADDISEEDKIETMKKLIITGETGKFSLSETTTKNLGLEAAMPIKQIISVGAGIDYKKGVTVNLKADSVTDRQLDITTFESAAKSKFKSEVKDVIKKGDYIIAAKDLVLNGYSAEITIDKSINAGLNAKMNEALALAAGSDAKIKITAGNSQDGTYVISASEPVIAAVLWKKPPKLLGTTLGFAPDAADDIDKWETRKISMDVLNAVEKLLPK